MIFGCMGLYNIQLIISGLKVLVGRPVQTFVIPNGVENLGVDLTSGANDMLVMLIHLKFLGSRGWWACLSRLGGAVVKLPILKFHTPVR